jgi:hypothetical protein
MTQQPTKLTDHLTTSKTPNKYQYKMELKPNKPKLTEPAQQHHKKSSKLQKENLQPISVVVSGWLAVECSHLIFPFVLVAQSLFRFVLIFFLEYVLYLWCMKCCY